MEIVWVESKKVAPNNKVCIFSRCQYCGVPPYHKTIFVLEAQSKSLLLTKVIPSTFYNKQ